jgi:carboxyl-terminal processing protease
MRRTYLVFLGAIFGVGLTLLATHPRTLLGGPSATAASSTAYQQLNQFSEVYERVRADYVEKPDDSKLVESAMRRARSAFELHGSR